jgi:hypothetical protein
MPLNRDGTAPASHKHGTAPRRHYTSIARLKAVGSFGVLKIRALLEDTYVAGLRKAGMPEE